MQATVRARVHDETAREIKRTARRQLAEHGPAGLSLRAVARELGMVSSAVYRYYPSRDELLSALVVDACRAAAATAEAAEAAVRRPNLLGRWLAVTGAVRGWALQHPQEYALGFGSAFPGHPGPASTVAPRSRIPLLVARIVADAAAAGGGPAADRRPIPRAVRTDLRTLGARLVPAVPEYQLAEVLLAWTELVGSVSSEVFGHWSDAVTDPGGYFDYQMHGIGRRLGLTSNRSRERRG